MSGLSVYAPGLRGRECSDRPIKSNRRSPREQPILLASTSSAFGNLQSLRLALSLATRDPALVPTPLFEQVRLVIQEALRIVNDPSLIDPTTRPEAISLAYAMRSSPDLITDVQNLTHLQGIDKATAGTALQHLDAAFAA